MKTLIAIPVYNEAKNIENLVLSIEKILSDYDYSILFINDNSADGTTDIIQKLIEGDNKINVLNRPTKLGLATAYIEAFNYGIKNNYENVIQMDADFSHNPKYLPLMLEYLNEYSTVIASRNINGGKTEGWGITRNIISKGGSLYSRLILNCPISDLTGGFNGWKTDLLKQLDFNNFISNGFSFQIELKYKAYKKSAKIKEFPIIFQDRKYGESKMSKQIFLEALLNVIKIRFGS